MNKRLFLCTLMLAVSTAALAQQTFPSRPIRFIVPIGPGSGSDNVTRIVAKLVATELGQATFVENKPGADTILGVQAMLGAPADGHTLMMISPSSVVINPLVNDALPYKPERDIRPLATALRSASLLLTGANSPYHSVADVLAAARRKPGTISLANYGHHYRLGGLLLQQQAGVEFNHVPYKTPSQVQSDLVGGSVDLALMDVGGSLPLIASGKLRALAVTSKERHPQLPQVPTVRESGVPNYELYVWIGLGISSKTPQPIAQALEVALLKAMTQSEFRSYVTQNAAAEVYTVPGVQFAAMIAAETQRYRQLIKQIEPSSAASAAR